MLKYFIPLKTFKEKYEVIKITAMGEDIIADQLNITFKITIKEI